MLFSDPRIPVAREGAYRSGVPYPQNGYGNHLELAHYSSENEASGLAPSYGHIRMTRYEQSMSGLASVHIAPGGLPTVVHQSLNTASAKLANVNGGGL